MEPKYRFDYIKNSPKYYAVSGIIIAIIAIATLVIGLELDIQFKGGSMITYAYEGALDISEFQTKTEELLGSPVSIQQSTDIATGLETFVISLPGEKSLNADKMTELTDGLKAAFPAGNPYTVKINSVDPTMGKEFLLKCLVALVLAMALVMLYVAIRFRKIGGLSAGAMGVVALLHDCIVVYGVFVIFGIPINENFIAVILTILGFSLNDTVVIYDRIRENQKIYGRKMPLGDMVNRSINQSLTRSINTACCAVMAMVVVTVIAVIFNIDSIFSFSFPLIIGLISGAYSTICLAGPLWVKWQTRKDTN